MVDLSSVWIVADIYEYELPLIKLGQTARIGLSYFPGKEFSSQVDYVYPALASETRTAKVRFTIPNPEGVLKPQMFTNVEIKINLGNRLIVPSEAVIDTGERQIVYVDKGEGFFEPREVTVGLKADGVVEVTGGIRAGEKVASSANFLIDSEAQLKGVTPLKIKRNKANITTPQSRKSPSPLTGRVRVGVRNGSIPACYFPLPLVPSRRGENLLFPRASTMIAKIIDYSARNRFIIFLLVVSLALWGYWALTKTPLDAIPDLSDTQVIIYTEWQGRSPDLVEDQITYPITSTLLAAPKVQFVRGFSFLGSSFIYVIFDEGTDIYWARSRVLEYLQAVKAKIPADVNPVLGPDATAVGWGFSYAVVDKTGGHDLAELRTIQDYNVKLAIESVPGVSQVASLGGFVKQYQITIDPNRLLAYNIPLMAVMEAVKRATAMWKAGFWNFPGSNT